MDHKNDTTLRLIEESLKFKVHSYWCDVKSICLVNTKVQCEVYKVNANNFNPINKTKVQLLEPSFFSQIHYRVDPPLDFGYTHPLQLLVLGTHKKTEIVNPTKVLFSSNEKFTGALVKSFFPSSLVSSSFELLNTFIKREKKAVLKPLYQAQGQGIELYEWGVKENIKSRLSFATSDFTRPVLLQKFLSQIYVGEKRLWFIDGKLLAYVKKHPSHGSFKVNVDLGSIIEKTTLSKKENKVAYALSRLLRDHKIRLAAIDLIGTYVTDFNITSPGLIIEMEQVLGENLAKKIIENLTHN
ncbi:MAG: hypothetical protein HY843_00990 [Bdellovibrio sp.]|nr:hypothetical protein [Bdellovibrio sp.]